VNALHFIFSLAQLVTKCYRQIIHSSNNSSLITSVIKKGEIIFIINVPSAEAQEIVRLGLTGKNEACNLSVEVDR